MNAKSGDKMQKPRKIPAAVLKRTALEQAAIAGRLAARVSSICAANDFIDDGRKGVDYAADRRGGSESTGPELAAMRRGDSVGPTAGEFMTVLERWNRAGIQLYKLAEKLAVDWPTEARTAAEGVARRAAEPAGAGDCAVCGRVVSGASRDRLRHGRCDACRKFFERNGSERPRELHGGDSIDAQCVTVLTRHGADHRCTLTVGHDDDHDFAVGAVA